MHEPASRGFGPFYISQRVRPWSRSEGIPRSCVFAMHPSITTASYLRVASIGIGAYEWVHSVPSIIHLWHSEPFSGTVICSPSPQSGDSIGPSIVKGVLGVFHFFVVVKWAWTFRGPSWLIANLASSLCSFGKLCNTPTDIYLIRPSYISIVLVMVSNFAWFGSFTLESCRQWYLMPPIFKGVHVIDIWVSNINILFGSSSDDGLAVCFGCEVRTSNFFSALSQ